MELSIPVPKGKKGEVIVFDTNMIPDNADIVAEIYREGLKAIAGRAMSKITKAEYPDEAERHAAARTKAEANLQSIVDGTLKLGKAKSAKRAAPVQAEALRLAKLKVKADMKLAGYKISHFKASEITAAAKSYLEHSEDGKALYAQAEANLAAQETLTQPTGEAAAMQVKLAGLMKADPELVKKAEAKKAKPAEGGQLSAKQAGQTKKRQSAQPTA